MTNATDGLAAAVQRALAQNSSAKSRTHDLAALTKQISENLARAAAGTAATPATAAQRATAEQMADLNKAVKAETARQFPQSAVRGDSH